MNILLIQAYKLHGLKSSQSTLPVSLLYLAAYLKQAGHNPTILDLSVLNIPDGHDPEDYYLLHVCKIIEEVKPELVGINCFTSMHFSFVRILAQGIKKNFHNLIICLGGAHPTYFPHEILDNCHEFDFIVIGEGEKQILALSDIVNGNDYQNLKDIQAFAYREPSTSIVRINNRANYIDNLDNLPFPAYDMINIKDYYADHSNWNNPKRKKIMLAIPVLTSRGCPFNCNFCSAYSITGKKLRKRSPGKVVDEIEMLVRNYDQNYFSFIDDNVNVDKNHFISICREITKRGLDIQLNIAQGLYLKSVDEYVISAFTEAGGITVSVPIESGSEYIRNEIIGKNLTNNTIYEAVKLLKKYNLFTVGLFIMGFAEDTDETLNETAEMIRRLELDVNAVSTLVPFPGTKVYQQAKKDKLLLFNDDEIWKGEIFFDPQNKREFFIMPYGLSINRLRAFRDLFDSMYIYSDRAKALNGPTT